VSWLLGTMLGKVVCLDLVVWSVGDSFLLNNRTTADYFCALLEFYIRLRWSGMWCPQPCSSFT
jgi:hypothetical protein